MKEKDFSLFKKSLCELKIGNILIKDKSPILLSSKSALRHFEFRQGASNKFWEIYQSGPILHIRFGKIGSNGSSSSKDLVSNDVAKKEYNKIIKEKLGKGYKEIPSDNFVYTFLNPGNKSRKESFSSTDLLYLFGADRISLLEKPKSVILKEEMEDSY